MSTSIPDLLCDAEHGDEVAAKELFARLYRELHAVAEYQLRRSGPGITLGTTTLVHEFYLDLAERSGARFPDRSRFLAYAAKAMRGVILDYARARRAQKRGGQFEITRLGEEEVAAAAPMASQNLEALAEGLEQLGAVDQDLAQLVDLHFFCGFSFGEIAQLRAVSERTVQRDWREARMVLRQLLRD